MSADAPVPADVMRVSELPPGALGHLLQPLGLELVSVPDAADIPGSYWGETEAGLIGNRLYVRSDTPVHSALHEGCHWLCMDAARRAGVHTDAQGDDLEEVGVCYLQVLLADRLPGYSRDRLFEDMDTWGYTFALGSARAWFERDAEDARLWLQQRGLVLP